MASATSLAWASREFLRKLCIGKKVDFEVEYHVDGINRDFGAIMLGGENLRKVVAAAGFASVKDVGSSKGKSRIAELVELEQKARDAHLGMHTTDSAHSPPRCATTYSVEDKPALLARHKGNLFPCIVEYVKDGSSLRVAIVDGGKHISLDVFLTAIQSA